MNNSGRAGKSGRETSSKPSLEHMLTMMKRTVAESELNEILKYPDARRTFEELCAKGMERELLKLQLISLRNWVARKRILSVNPRKCKELSEKIHSLLRDIDDLHVNLWRHRRRRKFAASGKLRFVTKLPPSSFFIYRRSLHVPLDINLLREQLDAASRYFARVGKAKKPIKYGFESSDMPLRMLLAEVKRHTGSERYTNIALLCTAATGGHVQVTESALKMRASRFRK